jgi:hypothetical protein
VLIVTGLRALVGAAPSGECELHLACPTCRRVRGSGDDDAHVGACDVVILEVVRRVFTKARDMATAMVRW